MPDKRNIQLAAKALETTKFKETAFGEYATGNRRNTVGVLMSVLGWNGGTQALSENAAEALRIRKQSSEKDTENRLIYRQKVCEFLSEHIVGRMDYLSRDNSFKEIAQWLRLFLVD
jgi:hypothetical protein